MIRIAIKIAVGILAGLMYMLLVFLAASISGCKVSKQSKSSYVELVSQDSTGTEQTTTVTDSTVIETLKETKDTAIGLPGASLQHTGDSDTTIKSGNLTLRTYTDKKGKRHTECTADSLTLVVKGLIREKTSLARKLDSAAFQLTYRKDSSATVVVYSEKKVARPGWLIYLLCGLAGAVTGVTLYIKVWPFVKRFINHWT